MRNDVIKNWDEVTMVTKYPSGENHVQVVSWDANVVIANIRTFEELFLVVETDRILKRNGLHVKWFIPFFPGARHDRRRDMLDGLEIELAFELIRGMDVITLDPHSEVCARLTHIPQEQVVKHWIDRGLFEEDPALVIPDAGATKKALTWMRFAWFPKGSIVIQGMKQRDTRTGTLTGFKLDAPKDLNFKGRPVVIVDDLCDAGGTFLGLAEVIQQHNPGELRLAVTHGLFTKGIDDLAKVFGRIYTTGPVKVEKGKKTPIVTVNHLTLWKNSSRV